MKKPKIIFVDDEKMWSAPYVRELEKIYEVLYRKQANTGLTAVTSNEDARLLILDIMMPSPSEELDGETENGLATGIWLLEQIRPVIIGRPLPVLILTNRILNTIARSIADVSIPKNLLEIRFKMDTPKFYIPHLVGEMLQKNSPQK